MRVGSSVGVTGIAGVIGVAGVTAIVGVVSLVAVARPAAAGTVFGRLELPPPPDRGPVIAKGFLDRVENPLAEIKKPTIAPYFVIALDGEGKAGQAPPEVKWDLVGESFSRPVVAVPVGAEVVIKNRTKLSWTIIAAEDPQLIIGPLNPQGTKSFRATQPGTYTIGDKDVPHLKGKIVVVATPYVAWLDDNGRFELQNVADGNYKLRVFYYDPGAEARGKKSGWLSFSTDVSVVTRGKANRTEVNGKLTIEAGGIDQAAGAAPRRK